MSTNAVNSLTTALGTGSTGRVTQAIATASRRTGVDFGYLMGQAKIESSLNPEARARTSSATGLFQFLDQSWLKVINDHGDQHGMGWAADAIQQSPGGRYFVSDPATRKQILDLRTHPETASVMAAEFAADNRAFLEQRIGRPADSTDLYLAHFLGAAGASKFLSTMAYAPDTAAAGLFPAAARSNPSIFYDRSGEARSLSEIRTLFASKLANGTNSAGADAFASPGSFAGGNYVQPADYVRIEQQRLAQNEALASEDSPYPELQATPAAARLAYLTLATLGR
ncbi:lytic transglycosylase domain-containing protein [Sphingobium sp. CR28]|uniref:lytic transglycosylase domain-containing protein n=1 Tax=Sphingobium sp. CR28 TaxID=3400272 RepID=UPI003FF0BEC0